MNLAYFLTGKLNPSPHPFHCLLPFIYRGSRAFGTNFHFLSVFIVSEKKNSWSRAKTNSKGVPRQTQSEIDKGLNEKNRPVSIWRRALANWRRALARKSSYFDNIAQLSVPLPQDAYESLAIEGFLAMGSFVERSHLLTAVSVVTRAWRYRLRRRHAPGLLLRM